MICLTIKEQTFGCKGDSMSFGFETIPDKNRSIARNNKTYVDVLVLYTKQGRMIPKSILWEDGTVYVIDKILDVCNAASLKAGGAGLRYKCRIQKNERFLWFETYDEKWFVEGK